MKSIGINPTEADKNRPKTSSGSGTGSATTTGSLGQTQQPPTTATQNTYKPQQNSYPFYAPIVPPVKVDGNYDL